MQGQVRTALGTLRAKVDEVAAGGTGDGGQVQPDLGTGGHTDVYIAGHAGQAYVTVAYRVEPDVPGGALHPYRGIRPGQRDVTAGGPDGGVAGGVPEGHVTGRGVHQQLTV